MSEIKNTLGYEGIIFYDLGYTDIDPKFLLGHDLEFSDSDKEKLLKFKKLTEADIIKEKLTQYLTDRKYKVLRYNPDKYED